MVDLGVWLLFVALWVNTGCCQGDVMLLPVLLVVVDGDGVECTLLEGGAVKGDKAELLGVVG